MATPGDLDTSFAGTGKKAINFGGTDAARAVLVWSEICVACLRWTPRVDR